MGFLVVLLGGRIIIIPVNLFQTSGGGTCLSDWMYYLGFCGFALPERGGGGGRDCIAFFGIFSQEI